MAVPWTRVERKAKAAPPAERVVVDCAANRRGLARAAVVRSTSRRHGAAKPEHGQVTQIAG